MADEKFQLVTSINPSDNALLMDSWDMMLAAYMIVLGYSDDVSFNIEHGLTFPRGHAFNEYSSSVLFKVDKFIKLAERALPVGKVKALDTPANWIKWAQSKGYDTSHLNPEHHIKTLEFILQDYENRPDISPVAVPEIIEAHKKNLSNWQSPYLTTRATTPPQAEALPDAGAGNQGDKITTSKNQAYDSNDGKPQERQDIRGDVMAISVLPPKLTLEQKAKLKKLDSRLSIIDIASLRYANDKDLIKPYAFEIAEACLKGELDFIHDVLSLDWRFICDNPEQGAMLGLPLDYETSPWPGSPEYSDINSGCCLESEWLGDGQPKPAYKYNDPLSRLRRFNANNWGHDAFNHLRCDYAEGGRCFIDAEPFKQWLIKNGDYPLPDDCLLNKWFESAIRADNYLRANWPKSDQAQAQALLDIGAGNATAVCFKEPVTDETPSLTQTEEPKPWLVHDPAERLAALFDPVPVETLAQMFPVDKHASLDQWQKWSGRASRNGLNAARVERAKFNPYKAGMWLVDKGAKGWDVAHIYRVLGKNLPPRSIYESDADLLKGDL
ncbi:MAG: hypothetical protein PHR16_10235 [Methylovulum sp.]|nr:hypothetical protein [Methylovulum sp.]